MTCVNNCGSSNTLAERKSAFNKLDPQHVFGRLTTFATESVQKGPYDQIPKALLTHKRLPSHITAFNSHEIFSKNDPLQYVAFSQPHVARKTKVIRRPDTRLGKPYLWLTVERR
ncbi:uncharacterized protein ZBAI_03147 [Zygosaccharomyces bailii ISA1307]|nr:uncharacterized protein ZBAI_03147 [Zygosaccharomyces bailii ISA1307]